MKPTLVSRFDDQKRVVDIGVFVGGVRHGYRITVRYPQRDRTDDFGEVSYLQYKNGMLHGMQQRWTYLYHRVLMAAYFDEGVPNGLGLYYWKTGAPRMVCKFNKHGMLHGVCRYFDPRGRMTRMAYYVDEDELSSLDFTRFAR